MGTKAKRTEVSAKHLAERNDFIDRRDGLENLIQSAKDGLLELEGERLFWRKAIINPTYSMSDGDMIEADGSIVKET
jgi:hypothetical protein